MFSLPSIHHSTFKMLARLRRVHCFPFLPFTVRCWTLDVRCSLSLPFTIRRSRCLHASGGFIVFPSFHSPFDVGRWTFDVLSPFHSPFDVQDACPPPAGSLFSLPSTHRSMLDVGRSMFSLLSAPLIPHPRNILQNKHRSGYPDPAVLVHIREDGMNIQRSTPNNALPFFFVPVLVHDFFSYSYAVILL